jgi:hypothetical protein
VTEKVVRCYTHRAAFSFGVSMGFSDDMKSVDDDVDAFLGDDILYKAAGTASYVGILGFIENDFAALNQHELDIAPNTRRVKVQKSLVPNPFAADRWQCALLGPGAWQKSNAEVVTAGRYWVIELQKASIQ